MYPNYLDKDFFIQYLTVYFLSQIAFKFFFNLYSIFFQKFFNMPKNNKK